MRKINREDMLELTRRFTISRSNVVRIAGAYIDEDGYIDGTFNTSFLNLNNAEKQRCLDYAKNILISDTNLELCAYRIPDIVSGSIWQLIKAIRDCELKNDALLLNLYEFLAEKYPVGQSYAIYVYFGVYDVPIKASDKERLDESEEVYKYIVVAIGATNENQEFNDVESGFLYPAFFDRSTDVDYVNIYKSRINNNAVLQSILEIYDN